ncbi:hypothetical protein LPB03_13070 [Polaribacter vadi]|uniref:Uncharacterized protein n=1 Tax=Polaribacter vadi TaxID=1774273 RepID=A0A1B8TU38_9FLAO|nr:hypothetical protein [Polaribacter vadi]AOW18325.1 hypothetical protein LPB03_13070 [Polaribacter vadi]OBY63058.1 hypothetical protein LPB3_13085 [Polaribacter vadi]
MKLFKKTYWLITPLLVVVFLLIFEKGFKIENTIISTSLSVVLAFVLSPKVKMVDKQHREEEQIKWLFFKKVINKKV